MKSPSESVIHTGDNRTGEGEGDDEQIIVDFSKCLLMYTRSELRLPSMMRTRAVKTLVKCRMHSFVLVDEATITKLLRFDLGEDFSIETAVVVCELYRHAGMNGNSMPLAVDFLVD